MPDKAFTLKALEQLKVAKTFTDNTQRVNSMSFSPNGEYLVTGSDDESIRLYNCTYATSQKAIYSKKYGVDLVQYCHGANTILHTSTKPQHTVGIIRYLSLHDNKYIRFFPGHKGRVTSLHTSPLNDTFISASTDGTVRMWDLRTADCQGRIAMGEGPNAAALDAHGLIFAVGTPRQEIKLFSLQGSDRVPFSTFPLPAVGQFTDMQFSNDGKYILVSTSGPAHMLVDAFAGSWLQSYHGHANDGGLPLKATLSPDGMFVISGSSNGTVHIWDRETGQQVAAHTAHKVACELVKFNPSSIMLASANKTLAFWIPEQS